MVAEQHGGHRIAETLAEHGVRHLFTLCGGHISPILVGAEERGLHVIDMRHEASAVFAADAVARLSGRPGVAAVTAGPGVTNSLTALKNAQLAESAVVVLGGATATVLKGRGALQDIDQLSMVRSAVKWATRVTQVAALGPTVDRALRVAKSGVPGPVFVEIPVDVLYPEETVRGWYLEESGAKHARGLSGRALRLYLEGHLYRQFRLPALGSTLASHGFPDPMAGNGAPTSEEPDLGALARGVEEALRLVRGAARPALVVGSQALAGIAAPLTLAAAIERLGIPVWLGGMARGLLGRTHPLQFLHERGKALKEADVAIVLGFPFDFRLKYGRAFGKDTAIIAANLSAEQLRKNRKPRVAVQAHPAEFLLRLSEAMGAPLEREAWLSTLREREAAREADIDARVRSEGPLVDPLHFFRRLDRAMADDAVLVADGGDFVATAAYTLRPRKPLGWLDPGVFGTLGVGGGFAVGAAALQRDREVWLLWGDGSSAYSLAELDTCVRHGLAPIAVVGNDGAWGQIARDQAGLLGSAVGTTLARTAYHRAAEGYGAAGLLLDDPTRIDETLYQAKELARSGQPVLVNVHLAATDFRKGSISI